MQKARDIMTKKVISVKKDTPIFDALEILTTNNITGIPVVREDMILASPTIRTMPNKKQSMIS
jgi:CBS domain-containing protein